MKSFAALAFAGVASATVMNPVEYEFMKFVTKYNRRYATVEEYELRLDAFITNHAAIMEHNATATTSTACHNHFSDWTHDEFHKTLGYLNTPIDRKYAPFSATNADEVDWVSAGAVTGVKNQGSCGSCWSFSTTGAMEGAHFIATGELLSLSEQNLVDCSHNGNLGCMGGLMDSAFTWTETSPLETEANYPYKGWTLEGCIYDSAKGVVGVKSFYDVTPSNSDALKAAIVLGPVSVAIQANQRAFQFYEGGVITANCGTDLDHGVLAVGFGTADDGTAYYKVKNSWGPDWGEEGYVRIAIVDGDGMCGIQMQPSQPTTN